MSLQADMVTDVNEHTGQADLLLRWHHGREREFRVDSHNNFFLTTYVFIDVCRSRCSKYCRDWTLTLFRCQDAHFWLNTKNKFQIIFWHRQRPSQCQRDDENSAPTCAISPSLHITCINRVQNINPSGIVTEESIGLQTNKKTNNQLEKSKSNNGTHLGTKYTWLTQEASQWATSKRTQNKHEPPWKSRVKHQGLLSLCRRPKTKHEKKHSPHSLAI